MKEPILHMGSHAEDIIHKISNMVGSAAREDKTKISVPLDQVEYLIHAIKYAYAVGVMDGRIDSSSIETSLDFLKFFTEKYKNE